MASSALARVVRNTTCLPRRKVLLVSDLVLMTVLIASTVWEVSLSPNLDHRPNGIPSEPLSNLSSLVSRIYLHLQRIVPPSSIRPTSPFSPPVSFLSISVGQATCLGSKRKPGMLGAWWKFRNWNVVQVRVGALMEDARAGILVRDVVWKEIILPIPLVLQTR